MKKTKPVTLETLIQRINSHLETTRHERLCESKSADRLRLGEYHVINVSTKRVTLPHVILEQLSRELGVLNEHEYVIE